MLNLDYKPKVIVDTDGMPNDEWLKYRTTGIGGSDISVLFGVNPWTTPRSLYYNKIGMEKNNPLNQYSLDFGHAVEPFVAAWFQWGYEHKPEKYKSWLEHQFKTKLKSFNIYKDTNMYQHPLHPCLQANLDYRFHAVSCDGKEMDGIFECKTTNYHIFAEKWGWNKVPEYYVWQCRQYMSVMNLPYTIIACACGNNENDYAMGFVSRDLDKEEEMIAAAEEFWNNNVLARKEPPLADEEHAQQELDALIDYNLINKEDDTPPVELSCETLELVKRYQEKKDLISAYNKKIKELEKGSLLEEVKILNSMKLHKKAIAADSQTKWDLEIKTTSRTGLDGKRLKMEQPEIAKEYSKKSETTKLVVKKSAVSKVA